MTSNGSLLEQSSSRRRRAHTKSRRGCRNCKLRRVKCDEGRPQCQKCLSFGVACNYNAPHEADLEPTWQVGSPKDSFGSFAGQVVFSSNPPSRSLLPVVVVGSGFDSFQLDAESIARLDRFRHRTVFTFAFTHALDIYQNDVMKLGIENPFLMHIILNITAIHDRYLSKAPDGARRSLAEAYHGAKGAALLSKKLSAPIRPQDRDPLWASAAMLGVASMTSIEASSAQEAWPLKPFNPSDLDWLNMAVGKEAIWKVTDPLRPDSIFYVMADDYLTITAKPAPRHIKDIPYNFVELCGLDEPLAMDRNPYYCPVSVLTDVRENLWKKGAIPRYITFLSIMGSTFRILLERKDARALLILAYWYGPICRAEWWMAKRARLECQAICLYLEKYHTDENHLQRMLTVPKSECGLIS
ncbi:uncharacterized protein N7459_007203 [Penicillium hispanicum]|uniref:uncharacterized protein n=1 Tax=Penicillium hispanicum TaxID=1080232 RepID=UPI0025400D65|nr:uncharacterized protein N7459_007203 [Penicillium hispanicum]KAJ5578239.1 hypothetical protein N7459_007203 [Penicillium hispanicum]